MEQTKSIQNLGVTLDADNSRNAANLCCICCYNLQELSGGGGGPQTHQTAVNVAYAIVNNRLDYCNSQVYHYTRSL